MAIAGSERQQEPPGRRNLELLADVDPLDAANGVGHQRLADFAFQLFRAESQRAGDAFLQSEAAVDLDRRIEPRCGE